MGGWPLAVAHAQLLNFGAADVNAEVDAPNGSDGQQFSNGGYDGTPISLTARGDWAYRSFQHWDPPLHDILQVGDGHAFASAFVSGSGVGGAVIANWLASGTDGPPAGQASATVNANFARAIQVTENPNYHGDGMATVQIDGHGGSSGGAVVDFNYHMSIGATSIQGSMNASDFTPSNHTIVAHTHMVPVSNSAVLTYGSSLHLAAFAQTGGASGQAADFSNTFWFQMIPDSPGMSFITADGTDVTVPSPDAYLPGDANSDGEVDSVDFDLFAYSFGQATTDWFDGDFNGDRITNTLDFNALATNFGRPSPISLQEASSAAASALVPEPAMMVLLPGAFVMLRRRR